MEQGWSIDKPITVGKTVDAVTRKLGHLDNYGAGELSRMAADMPAPLADERIRMMRETAKREAAELFQAEAGFRQGDCFVTITVVGQQRQAQLKLVKIIKAVNSHERLVAALHDIQAFVESDYGTPDAKDDPVWKIVDAALAEVEK